MMNSDAEKLKKSDKIKKMLLVRFVISGIILLFLMAYISLLLNGAAVPINIWYIALIILINHVTSFVSFCRLFTKTLKTAYPEIYNGWSWYPENLFRKEAAAMFPDHEDSEFVIRMKRYWKNSWCLWQLLFFFQGICIFLIIAFS